MQEMVYRVTLQAPLGERLGELRLNVDDGNCEGTLDIMRFSNRVKGTLDERGHCRLTGQLRTLLHTRSFEGEGMLGDTADICLHCGPMKLTVLGKRVAQGA